MSFEVVLPWRPVPLERARSDRGVTHDTPRNRLVKRQVAQAWRMAYLGRAPFPAGTPLILTFVFHFDRPAGHYVGRRKGGELRADAPRWHTGKPDADNLVKLIKDGLNGVAWADDAQVAAGSWRKTWTTGDARTVVTVAELVRGAGSV